VHKPFPVRLSAGRIDRPAALVCRSLAMALAMLAAGIAACW